MSRKFRIYWTYGESVVLEGGTVAQAFTNAGYGQGAIHAVDFFQDTDVENPSHLWDKDKKTWVPVKPAFNPE